MAIIEMGTSEVLTAVRNFYGHDFNMVINPLEVQYEINGERKKSKTELQV